MKKMKKGSRKPKPALNGKICFKKENEHIIVPFHDIIYCKAEGSYTRVYLRDKRDILDPRVMKKLEQDLPKGYFLRYHNSYLINIKEVISFNGKERRIKLDNVKIPVSRRKYKEVV